MTIEMDPTNGSPWRPHVSVVLPIYNEARFIAPCLDSVLAQDYPADLMEVIVADGMSTDGTRDIVAGYARRDPRVRLISNPGRIVPTGLNAAIAEGRGDVVVRVDGHCAIAKDYVRQCVRHLQAGFDAVGGPLETIGETPHARAIAMAMSSTFGVGNSAFRTVSDKTMVVDSVAFPAFTRSVLDKLGPFDEELVRNQDDEFNYRLRKAGGRILLAADVRSRYFSRSSMRSLWRQYFQYGYWKVRVLQKHPRQMCARQFVPPIFVAGLLLSALLAPVVVPAQWLLVAVAAAYLSISLLASLRVAGRDVRMFAALPPIFATLHLGYGLGFLAGLVRFARGWRAQAADGSHASLGVSSN